MKYLYDNVSKNNISYFDFIGRTLDQLGFKATFKGTNYLKHLIIYIFSNDYYNIYVEQIVVDFIKNNNISISKRIFILFLILSMIFIINLLEILLFCL